MDARKKSGILFSLVFEEQQEWDEKEGWRELKERTRGDTHSLLRLSNPEKAPLVSSIVPEMSLWSSSLWRMREKRGIREMEGGEARRTGTGSASAEAFHRPGRGWSGSHGLPPSPTLPLPTLPPPYIAPPLHLALRAPRLLCSANQAHSFLRGVEKERACEYLCMCLGVSTQTQRRETHV